MDMEKMVEIIKKEERDLWEAFKKVESKGRIGTAEKLREQHNAILNLMDELGIER